MINEDNTYIGKIIVYRKEGEFQEEEAVVIFNSNPLVPNTVRFVEYPIKNNSRFGYLGLSKYQEKPGREYLNKPGDWFYVDNVTEHERKILENIIKTKSTLSEENY